MSSFTKTRRHRRGQVAILAALLLIVLFGAAAFGVDMTYLTGAKRQLHTAVDSCALATAQYIASQGYSSDAAARAAVSASACSFGTEFLSRNPVEGIVFQNESGFGGQSPGTIQTGIANIVDGRVVGFTPNAQNYDAVSVSLTMSQQYSLPAILGPLMGHDYYHPQAQSVVLLEMHPPHVLPFTILDDLWDQVVLDCDQIASELACNSHPVCEWADDSCVNPYAEDNWSWDEVNGVTENPDGLPELVLYPRADWQGPDGGDECGSGNFGALTFDVCGQGNACWLEWIVNGVPEEVYDEHIGGAPDAQHGDPGISLGNPIVTALENLIGEVIGVFVHIACDDGNGSNLTYRIMEVRYARMMVLEHDPGPDVPGHWILIIQPVEDQSSAGWIEVVGLGM